MYIQPAQNLWYFICDMLFVKRLYLNHLQHNPKYIKIYTYTDRTLLYTMNPCIQTLQELHYTRRDPKNQNLFIKNCVFILTCLNFSHLRNTLRLMQDSYWDHVSTAQHSVWTCQFWGFSVLLPFFVSSLPHQRSVYLWGLFSLGETSKNHSGQYQINREGGAQGSFHCWSKTAEDCGVGRFTRKPPSWNGQMHWKSFPEKFHWGWTQPLTTTPASTLIQMGS